MTDIETWPGRPYPLGHLRRHRYQLLAVLRGGRGRRAVPVRRRGRGAAHRAQRGRRVLLARLPAPGRRRPALRLPGARPRDPARGQRCNPNKLLLDPYAKAVDGGVDWDPACFPYDVASGDPASRNDQDSAPTSPRRWSSTPLRLGRRPPARDAVARVGDLRDARQGVHGHAPGHPRAAARHLCRPRPPGRRRLPHGPRRHPVELQPVHQFIHDARLVERGLRNYWGYNSIGFLAPTTSIPAPAATAPRSPSSRRWCGRSTRPASR